MDVETIWYYTGFIFWVVLAWLAISVILWAGVQFLYAMYKNTSRYKKVAKLPRFFKEYPECEKKFEEWRDRTFRRIDKHGRE